MDRPALPCPAQGHRNKHDPRVSLGYGSLQTEACPPHKRGGNALRRDVRRADPAPPPTIFTTPPPPVKIFRRAAAPPPANLPAAQPAAYAFSPHKRRLESTQPTVHPSVVSKNHLERDHAAAAAGLSCRRRTRRRRRRRRPVSASTPPPAKMGSAHISTCKPQV